MSNNQGIEERLDKVNKKLDLLIIILLVNSGMKLPDIAKTLGISVRTIQGMISIAKIKSPKNRKVQPVPEETSETLPSEEESQNNAS